MSSLSGIRALAGSLVQDALYGRSPSRDSAFGHAVHWRDEGCAVVRETLAAGSPCLVARLGSSELACVSFYTRWRSGRLVRPPYPDGLRRIMRANAGVFPVDDDSLDRFSETLLAAAAKADVMGVWFNRSEDRIVRRTCPDARLVDLESLNAVLYAEPWSAELAGKTVLVIHPFARSIESQYRTRRALLFDNPRTLPEFELRTLPAVQSAAGGACGFPTWFDALARMAEQAETIEADTVIVGAGAYGLPLAATAKELGRQAVHLGGATQLLFGIRGRRWERESPDDIAPLFNEHWVRPSAEETPGAAESVEGGCYW